MNGISNHYVTAMINLIAASDEDLLKFQSHEPDRLIVVKIKPIKV